MKRGISVEKEIDSESLNKVFDDLANELPEDQRHQFRTSLEEVGKQLSNMSVHEKRNAIKLLLHEIMILNQDNRQ